MFFDRPDSGERAVLVHLNLASEAEREDPRELEELVLSAGGDPVAYVIGAKATPDVRTFVGSGKLEEIASAVRDHGAEIVIFNHALRPSQERNLERELQCRVLDRTGLILDIFAQRARTHEGKLQVELAQLQHMSTRLVRGWTHLERQKGGIGLRGPGETQLETDRRLLRERIKSITARLDKVRVQREQGRRSRTRAAIPTVSLVGPFPQTQPVLINPVLFQRSADLDWTLIVGHLSSIGTIIMLSAVSLMLTASGLSVLQRNNFDINRELMVAGFANTVSGMGGGLIALPSMSLTELAMTVGAPRSRVVGLVVALFCALMLFFGMSIIAWFPKIVLAGLLIYLGASLLERWLIEARKQLPRLEYLVVVVIVLVVATAGFLQGVMVGLLCAIVLFVINYSRINVVRFALTGTERGSNVERNSAEQQFLRDNGAQTLILKLQGYLFFGTAAALARRIEERLADKAQPTLRYVAMDFAHVTDMDSSAALSFMKLAQDASQHNFFLVLTGLAPKMHERLMSNWFENESTSYVQIMPDLDRGIEWCEERILKELSISETHEGILQQLLRYMPTPDDHKILEGYLEHRHVESGDQLARQGDASDTMFLLQTCTASVYLDTSSGKKHRIRRAGAGTVFGEVGFYLGTPRTASVIVDTGGELFVLSQSANARLEQEHPHIAAALHKFMIRVITRRLQLTTTTLQAVLT